MRLPSRVFTVCVLALVSVLAACSFSSSPERTVETFYRAVAEKKTDKAIEQLALGDISAGEMVVAKGFLQLAIGALAIEIESNGGLKRVEVLESTVAEDGQSARVRVKLSFNNGKDDTRSNRLRLEEGKWKITM